MPAFTLDELLSRVKTWVTFAGCVLIVGVLYWAQSVIVPIALAVLLTFVLNPFVSSLERRIGNIAAVTLTTALVVSLLALLGYGLVRQVDHLAEDLPQFRGNIRAKVADIRGASKGGTVQRFQQTIDQIKAGLDEPAPPPRGTPQRPVVVMTQPSDGLFNIAWLGPIMAPLSKAALVLTLLIFMLIERRDLRDRLIGLVGHGQLAITAKAFEEAGARVSRQLLMQSFVNLIYGVAAAVGCYAFGVPYPIVWGALGGALRFIPYVGPIIGAGVPILVSLAALPGWIGPLWVVTFYAVLEVITNLVLETRLYAGAAGVSQVALLVSVAFWTFLWGPLGLLMATPLTVCLVVMGKHVPGLRFVEAMMTDSPAIAPEYGYYQRLLARDLGEAADLIDRYVKTESPLSLYDGLMIPALNYAERDRLEQRLSPEEEAAVVDATRELLADAAELIRRAEPEPLVPPPATPDTGAAPPRESLRVVGYAVNGESDALALLMLNHLLTDAPMAVEICATRMQATELVALVRERAVSVVCLADLPPSPPSKSRYLVKRLRAALPETRIMVGRWAPEGLADENSQVLREAGADHVGRTLMDSREYLGQLVEIPRVPEPPSIHAPVEPPPKEG